jgi:hypothetical protein
MKNTITVLQAYGMSCRTTYKADGTKERDLKETLWKPTIHTLNGQTHIEQLQDLKTLIEDCRSNTKGHAFIRGTPSDKRTVNGYWKRKLRDRGDGYYTTDVRQCLIQLDIDGLPRKEGQPYNAETCRQNLAEVIDFITPQTAMLIDFSSGAAIDDPSKLKFHAFMMLDGAEDNEFLLETYKQNYPQIDWRGSQTHQLMFLEEPIIEEGSDKVCVLEERTTLLDGELVSRFRITPLSIHAVTTRVSQNEQGKTGKHTTLNEFYDKEIKLIEGYRNTSMYSFFCKCAWQGESKQYWVDRYFRDPRRDKEHTLEYIEKQYDQAEEFVRGRYLKKITKKGKHMIINTEAEKVSQVLPKKLHKVWAVKSPQATYKTQSLKTVLPTDESVLLVGHRTILIRQICKEIGMDCYEDVDNDEYTNSERLGITYHSLHHLFNKHLEQDHEKFTKKKFNTVVIDECDQVISALAMDYEVLCSELHQEIKDVWNYLGELVRRADNVICMDADLSDITLTFLEEFRSDVFHIYNNSWKQDGKTVFRLRSPDAWLHKLSDEIEAGRNIFVTCETIKATKNVKKWIEINHPNIDCLRIDSKTKADYKPIFNNPNKEIPKLMQGKSRLTDWYGRKMRVMIVSPVMTTGVSIFRNKGYGFDSVMGMFDYAELYGGADMRQALRRVRDADTYYVYMQSIGNQSSIGNTLKTLGDYYKVDVANTPLEKVRKLIEIRKEMDKQSRIHSLSACLKDIGWDMKMIGERTDKDWQCWSDLNAIISDEEFSRLSHATDITDADFEKLIENQQNQYTYKKHLIKKCFYDVEITDENSADLKITKDMIERYAKGRITEKHKIRNILAGNVGLLLLEDMEQSFNNFQYTAFIRDTLGKVFDCIGFEEKDFLQTIENKLKPKIIFASQIDDELFSYIADKRNVETLDRLLKKYRLNYLSMQTLYDEQTGELNCKDENKLRAFMKIAKMPDYEVTYVNPKDVKAELGSLTLTKLRRMILRDKKSDEVMKYRVKLNKPQYIKELEIAICEKKDVSPNEMIYLRQNKAHLKITNYEPQYTKFLNTFIDNFILLERHKKTGNKTLNKIVEQAEAQKGESS